MADGVPSRPSVPPDLVHLLQLMHIRSEVVEQRLAHGEGAPPLIEELPQAAPSVLDRLVEARVRIEEQALEPSNEQGGSGAAPGIEEAAIEQPVIHEASRPEGATAALFSQPAAVGEPEVGEVDDEEADLPLLEMNAFEAGQPTEVEGYEPPVAPQIEASHEQIVEADQLLEPAETAADASDAHISAFEPDLSAQPEAPNEPIADPREDLAAIQADLSRMERDLAQYEQLTNEPQPPEDLMVAEADEDVGEGSGEDFQALLAGARATEPLNRPDAGSDGDEFPFLPADGDVRLRARNGPRPGAEFVGKSTLAGAIGMFCLIHGFNLPLGTRMKVTLIAPDFADQTQIDDAVVSRLRKAPDNSTEVQLMFDTQHGDVEEFVAQHFGKPGFSLFGRRRPKR